MTQFFAFMTKSVSLLALSGLSFALSACSSMDPLTQPYTWRPLHVYDANIAAQVERKSDLYEGRHLGPSDGHRAAVAVQRWRDDKVRKLPDTNVAQVQSNSASSAGGDGGDSGGPGN